MLVSITIIQRYDVHDNYQIAPKLVGASTMDVVC